MASLELRLAKVEALAEEADKPDEEQAIRAATVAALAIMESGEPYSIADMMSGPSPYHSRHGTAASVGVMRAIALRGCTNLEGRWIPPGWAPPVHPPMHWPNMVPPE